MNEIVKFKGSQIVITGEQFDTIKKAIVSQDATPEEIQLYFYDCDRRGVHPLDKLIHFTKRSGKYTPIVSIDYMRMRAESSGAYAGSDDAVFVAGAKYPESATVTVWKMIGGIRCPFSATARWSEYAPAALEDRAGFMWRKMPHTMIAKCAEALALRKAFPGQLAGLYSNDEMAQAGVDISQEWDGKIDPKDEVIEAKAVEAPKEKPIERPLSPDVLKSLLARKAETFKNDPVTEGARKVLAAALGKVFNDDTKRYEFCKWAVGEASTKKMAPKYVHALLAWLNVAVFEDMPDEMAVREAMTAHTEALKASGQQELI